MSNCLWNSFPLHFFIWSDCLGEDGDENLMMNFLWPKSNWSIPTYFCVIRQTTRWPKLKDHLLQTVENKKVDLWLKITSNIFQKTFFLCVCEREIMSCSWHIVSEQKTLIFTSPWANTLDDTLKVFFIFPGKQDLTFYANCFHWRQFAWNEMSKSSFRGKNKKNISVHCRSFAEKFIKNAKC